MTFQKTTPATVNINAVAAPTPIRPGISESALKAAGIRHVSATEAQQLVGYPESGILIPFHNSDGSPLMVDGRPFYRLRTVTPNAVTSYLPPLSSGTQVYVPQCFQTVLGAGKTLHITEGEFKALSLCGAGIAAIGVSGITGTDRSNSNTVSASLPVISHIIAASGIRDVVFVGDRGTVFDPELATQLVLLAKSLAVELKVMLLPVDFLGKGIDDVVSVRGAGFASTWQELNQHLVFVTPSDTPSALAWKLLSQDVEVIAQSDGERRTACQEGLVRLAARFTDDVLFTERITGVAERIGLPRRPFNNAVKAEKAKRAENDLAEQLQGLSGGPENNTAIYYDGTNYYRCLDNGIWDSLPRADVQLHFAMQGFSKMGPIGEPSPVEKALYAVQQRNRVEYAGKLCGRRAGYVVENGYRFLVTQSPRFIEGVSGDYPRIKKIISDLFGVRVDHPEGATQVALFMGWLKLARMALRNPEAHSPGQALAVIGPPNCGKSFLINQMISPALGGRAEDATGFFLDKTEFNANLWGAELLIVGDKGLGDSAKDRAKLRDNLKKAVAETWQGMRPMYHNPLTMRPIWRIVVASNDSAENISDLPTLDASFADKIIYLKCFMPPEPLFQEEVAGAREALTKQIRDELPAFLHAVDNYKIPANLVKGRFGITEWHHPDIVEALNTSSHLQPIAEAIHKWIKAKFGPEEQSQTVSSAELYDALAKVYDGKVPHQTCSGSHHLGRLLASLSESPNWHGFVVRGKRRIGNNQNQTVWTITKPEGEEFNYTGSAPMFTRQVPPPVKPPTTPNT